MVYFIPVYNILKVVNNNQKVGTKIEEFIRLLDEHSDYVWHEIVGDIVM